MKRYPTILSTFSADELGSIFVNRLQNSLNIETKKSRLAAFRSLQKAMPRVDGDVQLIGFALNSLGELEVVVAAQAEPPK